MSFEAYVRRRYCSAVAKCREISLDKDMLDGAADGSLSAQTVRNWLQEYRVLRNLKSGSKTKIAKAFLAVRQEMTDAADCADAFEIVHEKVFGVKKRGWISLSSKLVWCARPEEGVMIDRFVTTSLKKLRTLNEPGLPSQRLGTQPTVGTNKNKIESAKEYYSTHAAQVTCLYEHYADLLQQLRKEHSVDEATPKDKPHVYDVRIMDKLLWMLGNPDQLSDWELSVT